MKIACTIALVLLMDVSASISEKDFQLQTNGLALAFAHPTVQQAVANQLDGVVVKLIHWASTPRTVLEWTHLRSSEDLQKFSQRIQAVGHRHAGGMTATGEAINRSIDAFNHTPCEPEQKIIDISGDGESNMGVDPAVARDRAAEALITINGLVVLNKMEPEVANYFRNKVITPDGFVVVADGHEDFAQAMRRKLSMEISRLLP